MALKIASRIINPHWQAYCAAAGLTVDHVPMTVNDEDANIEMLRGYDAVIAGMEPYSQRVLEALQGSLKIIARHGIGYDRVDVAYAEKLGICCCNTPGAMSTGVAETALIMMLELSRKLYVRNAALSQGRWDKGAATQQFEGTTVGLLGFGSIAQCLARYLSGFTGSRVLAYDIRYNEEALERYRVQKASVEEIAKVSDFVSVHVPLTPGTEKMVNGEFLSMMKPTAYLINTSRGGTVDEAALIKALKAGTIAGAAMDVFEREPADPDNELFKLDNVFKTPHVATFTDACARAGFDGVIRSLKEFEAGLIPAFALNPGYIRNKNQREEDIQDEP